VLKWSLAVGILVFIAHIVAWLMPSDLINLVPRWLYYPAMLILAAGLGFVGRIAVPRLIERLPQPSQVYRWSLAVFVGFGGMFCTVSLIFAHVILRWLGVALIGSCLALLLTTAAEVLRAAWYAWVAARRQGEETPAEQADPSLRSG